MDESYQRKSDAGVLALYRVWCCGSFRVERYINGNYCAVETKEWGGHSSPRTVLKALICAPRRRKSRGALLAQIWPEAEEEQATRDLNVAIYRLRKILTTADGQECLAVEEQSSGFSLADQARVWVDADAAFSLVDEAKKVGHRSPVALPLLEEAWRYFQRGGFLENDEGEWCANRRAMMERARYRCQLWLAEASAEQGNLEQAETLLNELLSDDPTDEDVICRLMALLHQRGLTHQALVFYKQTCDLFAREDLEISETTRALAAQLPDKRQALSVQLALPERKETPSSSPQFSSLPGPCDIILSDQLIACASLLKLGESIMFDPAKRKTLETLLAVLGAATIQPRGVFQQADTLQQFFTSKSAATKIDETTLQGFEQLIGACWQFSKGSDLALAEQLLPNCMTQLIPVAQQPSKYQATAASLAAKGYQLYCVLALHHNDLPARGLYGKQAVQYGLISDNPNILVPALRELADTYRYLQLYPQMQQTYLQALQYIDKVSPLLQSCVYRGSAIAYAHLGQKQEALRYIGLARDVFPDHPATDPSFSFAEFDFPWLIMGEGMVHSQIGQTKQALDIFSQIDQPDIAIPERVRLEIINQQGKTAIVSGDLEQGVAYVEAGTAGARSLGSQRRLNEAYENCTQMTLLWPQEKRVRTLAEAFRQ